MNSHEVEVNLIISYYSVQDAMFVAVIGWGSILRIFGGLKSKAGWTDEEILRLLEDALHYVNDWKSRNEKECVCHFYQAFFLGVISTYKLCEC